MNKNTQNSGGFTLIELTIYSGLLGILLVILSEFFITIINFQLKTTTSTTLEQDSEYILARTAYDIRRVSSIQSPAVGVTAAALDAVITDNGVNSVLRYDMQNGNLMLTIDSQATQVNSKETAVTDFSVSRIGNSGSIPDAKDSIQLSFTLVPKATQSGNIERPFLTTINLR